MTTGPKFISVAPDELVDLYPEPEGVGPNRKRRRQLASIAAKRVKKAKKGVAKALDRRARQLLLEAFEKSKR